MSVDNPFKRIELRAASGNLTANEITTAIDLRESFRHVIIQLNVTALTVSTEAVDFYIQTTYDEGTKWVDLINLHLDDAFAAPFDALGNFALIVHQAMTNKGPIGTTDGALADNTSADLPIGDQIRIKTLITSTPTYAYTANGTFYS